jgi:hypothetical protein
MTGVGRTTSWTSRANPTNGAANNKPDSRRTRGSNRHYLQGNMNRLDAMGYWVAVPASLADDIGTHTPVELKEPIMTIQEGAVYLYQSQIPANRFGHRYQVKRFVMDVPSYQRKVVFEALTGPDQGNWYCCSEQNFAKRYRLAGEEEVTQ